ncbi:MAG: hypothetical protein DRP11_00510 [Candidatus Aenigmatarchaeota archaeon]|nr:MAG: hypothetical protein DRP11_00510 [Candidatus Aenigmarchaeota archaeon]
MSKSKKLKYESTLDKLDKESAVLYKEVKELTSSLRKGIVELAAAVIEAKREPGFYTMDTGLFEFRVRRDLRAIHYALEELKTIERWLKTLAEILPKEQKTAKAKISEEEVRQ